MRRPRIVVTAGYEAMSLAGAEIVDATIRSLPGAVLALPTGGTPVGMYACLATMYRERGTDWSGVTTFNLDEYCDTGPDDPQSYAPTWSTTSSPTSASRPRSATCRTDWPPILKQRPGATRGDRRPRGHRPGRAGGGDERPHRVQ